MVPFSRWDAGGEERDLRYARRGIMRRFGKPRVRVGCVQNIYAG